MTTLILTAHATHPKKHLTNVLDCKIPVAGTGGEFSSSASLDSGIQANRRNEDEVDCTDHESRGADCPNLKRKRDMNHCEDEFEYSYEGSGRSHSTRGNVNRYKPINLSPMPLQSPRSPGSITPISEQDSLQKRRSNDTNGSNLEASFHNAPFQNSGNFAPPSCAGDPGSCSADYISVHRSPYESSRSFLWSNPIASTPTNSPHGSNSPSVSTVTQLQCTSSTSQIGNQNGASAYPSQDFYSSTFSSLSGYFDSVDTSIPPEQATQTYNDTSGATPTNGVESTRQTDRSLQDIDGARGNQIPAYAMPTSEETGCNPSQVGMADSFTTWYGGDNQFVPAGSLPIYHPSPVCQVPNTWWQDQSVHDYLNDPVQYAYLLAPLPETVLLEGKRENLLYFIHRRFNGTSDTPLMARKEAFMEGIQDNCREVLSLDMMRQYISSYWEHVDPLLAILHKPTFNANTCPELLLLAIMCLGASSLEMSYDQDTIQSCARLANFLAWHLGCALYMNPDAHTSTELWAAQSLILLRFFEMMYSTRRLRERADIHHATSLTLIRRRTSFTGRSATGSHPSVKEESSPGISGTDGQDETWSCWITKEAGMRVMSAAFVIDSMHAFVFGHSPVMATHEMRLPLPCDNALWSARSSAEFDQAMQPDCVNETSFLDGLKKTLNKQAVRTSPFGRTTLMAVWLNLSWHANQWNLQTSSLGITAVIGGQDEQQGSLACAPDFWMQDFDSALRSSEECPASNPYEDRDGTGDDVSESWTILHHLSHMTTHVVVEDCRIYAGASEVSGKSITSQDYEDAERRMKEWARTARARHAKFHAFCLLSHVLVRRGRSANPNTQSSEIPSYSARDDHTPYRQWALYLATLVVWSYHFALEGSVQPLYQLPSEKDQVLDMVLYLNRMGGVKTPEDLSKISHPNTCLGLLIIMRDKFKQPRWELLQEAGPLVTRCIKMLLSPATSV